jgi:hypothetical protein
MRVPFAYAAPLALVLVYACGSDGSDSGHEAADAAVDASSADAGEEDCLFCGSIEDVGAPQGDDSSIMQMQDGDLTSCGQMEAALGGLQALAQTCNSNLTMQCNGSTMGVCCPITVTASSTEAVNNFDVAVAGYVAACPPDCSMVICNDPAPSHACVGSAATGQVCQ